MVPGMGRSWLLMLCLRLQKIGQVFTGAGIIWVCQVSSTSGLVRHVGRCGMLLCGCSMRLSCANMGGSSSLLAVAGDAVVQDGQHPGLIVCQEHLQCGAGGRQNLVPGLAACRQRSQTG